MPNCANSKGLDDEGFPQDCSCVWLDHVSNVRKRGRGADSASEDARKGASAGGHKVGCGQARCTRSAAAQIRKVQLENGLEVILSEDHRLPMVAVNLWYH